MLWLSFGFIVLGYATHWWQPESLATLPFLSVVAHNTFVLVNTIWWGVLLGWVMMTLLGVIPRELVTGALGSGESARGIIRATVAGVLLDLCSHGILMVAAKLYERGASTGQVMAFLIASPWNSFSFTLVLFALIGVVWTAVFIAASMLIAVITGLWFERLVRQGTLPPNPHRHTVEPDFEFWSAAQAFFKGTQWSWRGMRPALVTGLKESRMVLRWILFGMVLAALVQGLLGPELFTNYFGPTLAGIGLTLMLAAVIEVCTEGSVPLAAGLVNEARAPGNGFAFLMGGVATDYTEIMVLKEASGSWKMALALPLLTLPQVLMIGGLMNMI